MADTSDPVADLKLGLPSGMPTAEALPNQEGELEFQFYPLGFRTWLPSRPYRTDDRGAGIRA